jgi:hypothetical protein
MNFFLSPRLTNIVACANYELIAEEVFSQRIYEEDPIQLETPIAHATFALH